MIKVLRSWDEVGHAINTLRKKGLCLHGDPVKNWDLLQINEILENYDKTISVLDMGCGETNLAVIRFLCQKGLRNCCGIDLSISRNDRLSQISSMVKNMTLKPPFRLMKGDLTKTKYPNNSFDVIICLSVIEHGVNIESFLKETSRILKSSGSLYISTDYWEPKLSTDGLNRPFNLNWNIFSKEEIRNLISLSKNYDFHIKNEDVPPTEKKIINWNDRDFTVISLVLQKK